MNNIELYLKLSDKLGWGDMQSHVAIPAIEKIVTNYAYINSEMYGISMEEQLEGDLQEAFQKDILSVPTDDLFSYLIVESIDDCYDRTEIERFISHRSEIETSMRSGMSFMDAILENYVWKS